MGALGAVFKILPVVLPAALEAIKLVEKLFGGGKGEDKKGFVVSLVRTLILSAEGIKGEDIVDEDKVAEGAGKVVDGLVDILNATGVFGNDDAE